MASVKRKAVTDERPSKKAKSAEDATPGKKAGTPKPKGADGERKALPKSILQQEDHAFPRGGGSVLTPIEQKQIKAQAERDVLFEQETGQKAPRDEDEEDAGGDEDLFDEPAAAVAKKKRKAKNDDHGASKKGVGSSTRIQGLSYKNLVVGAQVLGYVTAITSKDVALALANNLTGFVPITAVSSGLNARIDKLLADEEENEDSEDVDMKKLFHVGQWLRATVTSTGSDTVDGKKSKRHIELTTDPHQVNGQLRTDDVVENAMIQASVKSIEDHGLVMDVGLADTDVKGFISKKELGTGYDLDKMQEGQVLMCLVTGKGSNGKVLKLSPDAARFSALVAEKNAPIVVDAPTVDSFLPGMAVQILVTESSAGGVAGKVMGMMEITADLIHAGGAAKDADLEKKYKVGSKIKGRIIWTFPSDDGSRRTGVSLLENMLALPPPPTKLPVAASAKLRKQAGDLRQALADSAIVDDAAVIRVLPERGLFLSLPTKKDETVSAFAHISQISDHRIETLSSSTGLYKLDSTHRARIVSYDPVDGLYYVTLKKSVLEQTFLRLEDIKVGEKVKGTIERLMLGGKTGIQGVLVKLADQITGLVPEHHLSDIQLQHPERKFREGLLIKARVLSVDLEKRHVRLTLKKSLINADEDEVTPIWKDYVSLKPGMESKGTIVSLHRSGAAVQFFGPVRAWLPVAEMSEGFIENTDQHFRLGQTVSVRILSVHAEKEEMKVSCKQSEVESDVAAWEAVEGGQLVNGTVTEKGGEGVSIDLESGLRGVIRIGHLADGAHSKAESALKRLRTGQKLTDLVVLSKTERSRQVVLSNKASLVKGAKRGTLIKSFENIEKGSIVHGFVRNVTPEGVYIEFANGLVGLMPKGLVGAEMKGQSAFGLLKDMSISALVADIDTAKGRFLLSKRAREEPEAKTPPVKPRKPETMAPTHAVSVGQITTARIASVKGTQLNVRLPDDVQGRVDVSEIFETWDDIESKKRPLDKFSANEELQVKVLGVHDARNHRFLPISHRESKASVFELSAKKSRVEGASEKFLGLDSIKPGETALAFVNNHGDNFVWASLSPGVRGRIAFADLSGDVGVFQRLEKHFPIGSALRVRVKSVDAATGRLDLTARTGDEISKALTLKDVAPGMVLPARITKIGERSINVQLSEQLAGPVPLVEISDDFDQAAAGLTQYSKNDHIRVCVLDVDQPNKKVFLSTRPSKVLSSSLSVKDPYVSTYSQVRVGDLVRGFIKHVGDRGVIVSLSGIIDAFVRISDLSDKFVKDWKSLVEIDQLVKGRVVAVDAVAKSIQISLKKAHVEGDYKPPLSISDLAVGMVVTGKVRKVEDFGAFIDIDQTQPRLSGLCHRSEVAAKRVEDVRKIYSPGDVVKAKVLSVDVEKRKIGLGLKASYFAEEQDVEEGVEDDVDIQSPVEGSELESEEEEDDEEEGGIDLDDVQDLDSEVSEDEQVDAMDVDDKPPTTGATGLKTSGFDWTGDSFGAAANDIVSKSEAETTTKKPKRKKAEIKVDMTGDLDKYGPRSASDFERQLLGQPNNSGLWIQYMAFQLQLSEIQAARDLAERALRTMHIREQEEKSNVWIAWLNLEVEYGDEDKVEDVFKRACEVQDPLEMHQKLASIYIDSSKYGRAEAIFERIVVNKAFRASPDVWLNYATFLMDSMKAPARARSLLFKALQSIPPNEHRQLTAKFAALEFRSAQGDPERARTILEGLVTEWPKWSSGWDMWVDLEHSRLTHQLSAAPEDAKKEARQKTRALYERMAGQKMKKRRARFIFKKWLEFEEKHGDAKDAERVKALAKEYVKGLQAGGVDEMEE